MGIKKESCCMSSMCKCHHGRLWLRGPLIGKGSFGKVYMATLRKPRSKYSCFPSVMAVKSAGVSYSGSLQKEREVLASFVGCFNIIQCLGEELTDGKYGEMVYNLLLEYASKGTLADVIKKSDGVGLPELVVKGLTKSILKGILDVHKLGYVHCDLKPENVLLVRGNGGGVVAKIGDFGSAKRAAVVGRKRKFDPYLRGTYLYMAPEAWTNDVQEPPGDVWALGCTVLEMLTGKPAWGQKSDGDDVDGLRKRIGYGYELPEFPAGISKECREFLKGCLVRKAKFRFTAEMLMDHPFMQGVDESAVRLPGDDDTENDLSSSLPGDDDTENVDLSSSLPKDDDKENVDLLSSLPKDDDKENVDLLSSLPKDESEHFLSSNSSAASGSYCSVYSDDEEGMRFDSLEVNQDGIDGNLGSRGLVSPPAAPVPASVA